MDDRLLRKMRLAAQFMEEQHKSLSPKQVMVCTQLTILMVLNDIKPDEDLSTALRATADYIDFMTGLDK